MRTGVLGTPYDGFAEQRLGLFEQPRIAERGSEIAASDVEVFVDFERSTKVFDRFVETTCVRVNGAQRGLRVGQP